MTDDHLDRIRSQFTRTAEIYARLMETTQSRSLAGMVALSGASDADDVLDVACGPGLLSMEYAKHCRQVTGFDATDAFLELARAEAQRRGLDNIRFQCGDASRLPFAEAAFDVVACRAAFHHFPEPAEMLAEMARVLKPKGRLVIADLLGSEEPDKAKLHDHVERLADPTHMRALPASELERLFRDAGLSIERQVRGDMHYDLEEWISAGAPDAATTAQIVALMESWLADDPADLRVRKEDGKLRFSHRTAAFVLTRG